MKLALRADPASLLRHGRRDTRSAERSKGFRLLVRAGFVARGTTYGLMGAIALALALGAGTLGAQPNQQGALSLLARTLLGRVALIALCVGVLAYAVWKITRGILGSGPEGGGGGAQDRTADLVGGIGYLGFLAVAVRVLLGSSGNPSRTSTHTAAGILSWPGGQLIVGVAGAVLIVVSLHQLYDALRGGFADDSRVGRMSHGERRTFMALGRCGLGARAVVFVLIGYFLLRTAIDFNPRQASGVDDALARLHHQPLGPWLVGIVAVGLLTFSVFSFFEARYRRL